MTADNVPVLDVAHLDDPQLLSMLDVVPLLACWAREALKMGLKPLPKRKGTKRPLVRWKPYQRRFPELDEHTDLFDRDDVDGLVTVLDQTGYLVIDIDGPSHRGRQVLAAHGVEIPNLCPRVISGSGRHHYYLRTTRRVGRHIKLFEAPGLTIDVLGEGLTVLPPSPHVTTGVSYRWAPPILGTVERLEQS